MSTFTTDEGREVRLRAVGMRFIHQILNRHTAIPPMTYEVELVGGGKQTFAHDEESAEQLGVLDEWKAHEQAKLDAEADKMQELSEFLLYTCVDEEPPPVEDWAVDFDLWGLEAPDASDKKAFKLFWIENELCPGPVNMGKLLSRIYQVVGLFGKDTAEEFESFFRLTVARLAAG